jgi:hypothetical protein
MCLRRWRWDRLGVARLWRRGCAGMVICIGHAEETAAVWNIWKMRRFDNIVRGLSATTRDITITFSTHTCSMAQENNMTAKTNSRS